VQEAVIDAPPALGLVTATHCNPPVQVLVAMLLQFELPGKATVGLDEHQVRGTPVMVIPCVSMIVGVMFLPVPCATV
jgi:hypothetical protein